MLPLIARVYETWDNKNMLKYIRNGILQNINPFLYASIKLELT